MSILRRALRSVAAGPDDRSRLRAAKAARDKAQVAVERAHEGTLRVHQLGLDADRAELEASVAEAAFTASIRRWASAGAKGNQQGDARLSAVAQTAREHASRLRMLADAASASLQHRRADWTFRGGNWPMTTQEVEAREALSAAEGRVSDEIWPIVLAEVEPDLKRALEIHAELLELLPTLHGFRQLTRLRLPYITHPSEFTERFDAIVSPSFSQSQQQMLDATAPWMKFGDQLLADSDARFLH